MREVWGNISPITITTYFYKRCLRLAYMRHLDFLGVFSMRL